MNRARSTVLHHLYLSPHLDDAALSCGGMIHQQIQAGERVSVLTICAGDPPPGPLSAFAQSLHIRWNTPSNAVALRRAEDQTALKWLGATGIHWPVPDCIYRSHQNVFLYASEQAIFGEWHPAEMELARQLAGQIKEVEADRVYAPLTLGHHVDHQLVRQAAELLAVPLVYYEDYPYAEKATLQVTNHQQPKLVQLTEANLAAKGDAIAAYTSQISSFWPTLDAMRAALRAFALRTGAGILAERLWNLA